MAKGRKKKYIWSKGRRKKATATLRLYEGKGEFIVNGKPIKEYFTNKQFKARYEEPLRIGRVEGKFHGRFEVRGGGKKGQLQAVTLALARALVKFNDKVYKPLMREAGLLTVDARVKERRKAGQMGKARKKKQSPKR